MARRKEYKEKVTQSELIAIAYEKYDRMVRDWESRKTGIQEKDDIIDHYLEMPRKKLSLLNVMYEIETGEKLFED